MGESCEYVCLANTITDESLRKQIDEDAMEIVNEEWEVQYLYGEKNKEGE